MAEAHDWVSPARVFARPTADQIWLGPAQQSALSQLSKPARARLLVGSASSGKSTLLAHAASAYAPHALVLPCRGPKDGPANVLTALLLAAELGPWELSEIEQRNLFSVLVQQRLAQGRRVVIVADDAQGFRAAAWEELGRLLALRVERRPAIELWLAGPPRLARELDTERLGIAAEDLAVATLAPPSVDELGAYVTWRLARFDLADRVTPFALRMLARLAGGRYAAVDVLCQMSLLLLRQLRLDRVDAHVVRQAIARLAERHGEKLTLAAETPAPGPPQGHLLVSRGGKMLSRAQLGPRLLLGRSEHNDVCLPSPYLSRHHAAIVGTPAGYYVVDLNSANGITVNGRRVQRSILCDRDVLGLGPFKVKVQLAEQLEHGSPLPGLESLADTAVLPQQAPAPPAGVRRVK